MELLVVIKSDENPDYPGHRHQVGDVICAQPDGWVWGLAEIANPNWRILKAPISQAQADSLIAEEVFDAKNPKKVLRLRQMQINVAQLDAAEGGKVLAKIDDKIAAVDQIKQDLSAGATKTQAADAQRLVAIACEPDPANLQAAIALKGDTAAIAGGK